MVQATHTAAIGVLPPGTVLGRYELIRQLAVGGMAELHLARARSTRSVQKLVVIKRILPHFAQNARFVRMFLEEARLAATLRHSNIAQVYDIGEEGGNYFFAMEYIHGEDLRLLNQVGAGAGIEMPLDVALSIAIGVCAGLHYAHERRSPEGAPLGIVHRDISPHNVLVSYDGQVKLVDFGIARAAGGAQSTITGSRTGKVSYMSPEQCLARRDIDRRSDIFSVGILLYELTTGTRLFKGEDEEAITRKLVDDPLPRPGARRPGYPPALEAIVLKALNKERAGRFATANELQIALEELARQQRIGLSPAALQRHMAMLFGDRLDQWRARQAAGMSFEDAVVKTILERAPRVYALLDDVTRPGVSPATTVTSKRRVVVSIAVACLLVALGIGVYVGREMNLVGATPDPTPDPIASPPPPTPAPPPSPSPTPAPPPSPSPTPPPSPAPPPSVDTTAAAVEDSPAPEATPPSESDSKSRKKRRRSKRKKSRSWDVDSPLLPD